MKDYFFWFALTIAIGFSHRHLSIPYVMLDKELRQSQPVKFLALPLILLGIFLMMPQISRSEVALSLGEFFAIAAFILVLCQIITLDFGDHQENLSHTDSRFTHCDDAIGRRRQFHTLGRYYLSRHSRRFVDSR